MDDPAFELILLQGAQADLLEIYARYGERVEERVDQSLGLLQKHPRLGAVYEEPLRRLIVPGSPFGIFYIPYPSRIVVATILDLRQDPAAIRRRLAL